MPLPPKSGSRNPRVSDLEECRQKPYQRETEETKVIGVNYKILISFKVFLCYEDGPL